MVKKSAETPKKTEGLTLLHEWVGAMGGNINLGGANLDSIEMSKSGNKLKLVLKRRKTPKDAIEKKV